MRDALHGHPIQRHKPIGRRLANRVTRGWFQLERAGNYIVWAHPDKPAWKICRYYNERTMRWDGWAVRSIHSNDIITWDTHLELCQIWIQAQPLWLQCNDTPS